MNDWAPFATRYPGPASKIGYSFVGESGPKRGDAKHSAEGWWPGIRSRLNGPDLASWHFTVGLGRTEQHYPISAHCWHAGDVDDDGAVAANVDLVGIEHLGIAGQPLTPYQVMMTVRISRWAAEQNGLSRFARYPVQQDVWTLVEHGEVSDAPTACPSNRIPWDEILAMLQPEEEDEMLRLLRKEGSGTIWATDLITRRKVPSLEVLTEMRAKGLAPQGFEEVSADLLDSIPIVADGGPA